MGFIEWFNLTSAPNSLTCDKVTQISEVHAELVCKLGM